MYPPRPPSISMHCMLSVLCTLMMQCPSLLDWPDHLFVACYGPGQTNLMNNPRFIKVFPTELCHLYLSPMKCIITLQLSKSFHTGLISQSFPQPKFCTIRQSNLLCISCSIRIVTYITYLNVYIILTIIEPYTPIKCVAMTV